MSAEGKSWAVAANVRTTGNSLEVMNRERVAMLPQTSLFDVTPDGKGVLTVQQSDSRVQLVVITNWIPQLRTRLAGSK